MYKLPCLLPAPKFSFTGFIAGLPSASIVVLCYRTCNFVSKHLLEVLDTVTTCFGFTGECAKRNFDEHWAAPHTARARTHGVAACLPVC